MWEIISKPASEEYRSNYDRIFGRKRASRPRGSHNPDMSTGRCVKCDVQAEDRDGIWFFPEACVGRQSKASP